MVTRKQSIENFSNKMDELINSSYILSEKKITNVLKAITSSKLFFELVAFCNDGYCYEIDRDKFAETRTPFVFDDDKQLIAFGVNLLACLDCKEEELLDILSKNYHNDNFDKSYKDFAKNFLTTLKNVMIKTVNLMIDRKEGGVINNSKPLESAQKKSPETFAVQKGEEEKGEIRRNYQTCYSDMQQIIISERNKIMHCRIKDSERDDLLTLLEAFKDCLFMGNKEQVRMSFVSYKYAASSFKKFDSEVEDIERILKFCKIL